MQRADEVLAWMALSRAPALDIPILSTAFEFLGGVSGLIDSSHAARRAAGVPAAACEFLDSTAAAPGAVERAWLNDPTHHLVPFTDSRYPCALHALEPGPIALYVAGNADGLNDPQLSIVGSRNPTPGGRDIAFEFAQSLAACGLGITSGLAEGIDSAAHRGALAAQGVTFAVLGSGVDIIYPRNNRSLSDEIRLQGALIS
jgi:DNA processing protein